MGFSIILSIILGILALLISIKSLSISRSSDERMKAVANLEFDEKVGIISNYTGNFNREVEEKGLDYIVRHVKNVLKAVSNLVQYIPLDKKIDLVGECLLPLLEMLNENFAKVSRRDEEQSYRGIASAGWCIERIYALASEYEVLERDIDALRREWLKLYGPSDEAIEFWEKLERCRLQESNYKPIDKDITLSRLIKMTLAYVHIKKQKKRSKMLRLPIVIFLSLAGITVILRLMGIRVRSSKFSLLNKSQRL